MVIDPSPSLHPSSPKPTTVTAVFTRLDRRYLHPGHWIHWDRVAKWSPEHPRVVSSKAFGAADGIFCSDTVDGFAKEIGQGLGGLSTWHIDQALPVHSQPFRGMCGRWASRNEEISKRRRMIRHIKSRIRRDVMKRTRKIVDCGPVCWRKHVMQSV